MLAVSHSIGQANNDRTAHPYPTRYYYHTLSISGLRKADIEFDGSHGVSRGAASRTALMFTCDSISFNVTVSSTFTSLPSQRLMERTTTTKQPTSQSARRALHRLYQSVLQGQRLCQRRQDQLFDPLVCCFFCQLVRVSPPDSIVRPLWSV